MSDFNRVRIPKASDRERSAYAHHVAGHYWALSLKTTELGTASLAPRDHGLADFEDLKAVVVDRSHLDAIAALVEATARLTREVAAPGEQTGLVSSDDFTKALMAARAVSLDPCMCECPRPQVLERLEKEAWSYRWFEKILAQWSRISSLAERLEAGDVLGSEEIRKVCYGL